MKLVGFVLTAMVLLPATLAAQNPGSTRLVVQQNGQALVTEARTLSLPKGAGNVLLPDLPTTIVPQTLQVRSKTSPGALIIQDIALDDDLLTPGNLLRRHVGKTVTLVLPDGKTRDGRVQKQAQVLSVLESPLFLIDGQVYSGPYEAILYPELPVGMASRPRLSMNVDNAGPERQELSLAYMAREITWRMDYVLSMNKATTSALLSGWVTLTNRSGRDYAKAAIELLAGEPRSIPRPAMPEMFAAADMHISKSLAFAESEEVFEYHLYKLKRPVSLANQQSRQVQLFESATIPVTRKLVGRTYALPSGRESEPAPQKLEAVVSFKNTEALGLGLALPKGTLRAFQEEGEARHFVGEASMERTAVGSSVEMRLGQVFDVSVERVVTQYEKTGKNSYRAAWELRIKNAKKQSQQVVLQEQLPGKWKVENASQKWVRPSAGVLEFVVDVPPSRETEPLVLKYSFSTEM